MGGGGILAGMPGADQLGATYLRALGSGDFFPGLFADTSKAPLTHTATMTGADRDGRPPFEAEVGHAAWRP